VFTPCERHSLRVFSGPCYHGSNFNSGEGYMFKGILFASVAMILTATSTTSFAATRLGSVTITDDEENDDNETKYFVRPVQCLKEVQFQTSKGSAALGISKIKVSYAHGGFGVIRENLGFRGTLQAGEATGWLQIPQNGMCVTAFILEANVHSFATKDSASVSIWAN